METLEVTTTPGVMATPTVVRPGIEAIQAQERQLGAAAQMLSAQPEQVVQRIHALLEEKKRLGREVSKWKQAAATGGAVDYMSKVQDVHGVKVLVVCK